MPEQQRNKVTNKLMGINRSKMLSSQDGDTLKYSRVDCPEIMDISETSGGGIPLS